MYSASVLEKAADICFFELELLIAAPHNMNTKLSHGGSRFGRRLVDEPLARWSPVALRYRAKGELALGARARSVRSN
jgi:hypothetical protein